MTRLKHNSEKLLCVSFGIVVRRGSRHTQRIVLEIVRRHVWSAFDRVDRFVLAIQASDIC